MAFEPWYRAPGVNPRDEVRDGRSFNPDEFAIALEQVVAGERGNAPADYRDPAKFFARNYFTRALRDHTGLVLRRLAGQTANTAPVMTLVTQFGGGKTHTLAVLYHLAKNGPAADGYAGVPELLKEIGLASVPAAAVAVFVGNAWDPQPGRETPWIDLARQLAGDAGVAALGLASQSTPPGTEALGRVFAAANRPVLILADEVLNFLNRHRGLAEPFHAFIQNLTVAMTGHPQGAMMISLPRSQTEMTDWDLIWQEKITKVVKRVAKDLLVNDEGEIAEVVRRRLFESFGKATARRQIAKAYADWCFERRERLPPEWTAVDTAATEAGARQYLLERFEACYPFHPATLSVFQRKWQALPQYQQTRGTLAMLAQWVSWAYQEGFKRARPEPLITLGSAPLDVTAFRSVVLGQLGEPRLNAAIEFDIAGPQAHARALDADLTGPLRDLHRRVGTAILFESSGGQIDKVAHLPELRFALGEPDVETTSVDNAAWTLEKRGYYLKKVGSDGFQLYHKARLKKVVSDRRASLDDETDIQPALRKLVTGEFRRGCSVPLHDTFPTDGDAIGNTTRLTLVVVDPAHAWTGNGPTRDLLGKWTSKRSAGDRPYPGALLWCVRKPGRELYEKVAQWLAWQKVKRDVDQGVLGPEYDLGEAGDLDDEIQSAGEEAREAVLANYRYLVFADRDEPDGLRAIDLGAGNTGRNVTLCGRVLETLKTNALLNENPGAGFLERRWPQQFKETGAWPLVSLRQSFLTGGRDRLLDPDAYLRSRLPEFVEKGEFGLASGQKPDGTYERIWFAEPLPAEEVTFEAEVYLLRKEKAQALKVKPPVSVPPETPPDDKPPLVPPVVPPPPPPVGPQPPEAARQLRLFGEVPPESWNRLGTKLIPKLRSGTGLQVGVEFRVSVTGDAARALVADLRQILDDLGIADRVRIENDWNEQPRG